MRRSLRASAVARISPRLEDLPKRRAGQYKSQYYSKELNIYLGSTKRSSVKGTAITAELSGCFTTSTPETPTYPTTKTSSPSQESGGTGHAAEKKSSRSIEESDSPYCSSVVLVKKKNGELRFCMDYSKLNAVTQKDCFPIPGINDVVDHIQKPSPGKMSVVYLDLLARDDQL